MHTSGVHSGQILAGQLALAALLAAVATGAPLTLVLAAPVALGLILLAFGRIRGRWLYEWLGAGLRQATRRWALPAGSGPGQLLNRLVPTATVSAAEFTGGPAGLVSDVDGLTAVLELGATPSLLTRARTVLPGPASLLPPSTSDGPGLRVQLLVTGVPAPAQVTAAGIPATSYRQLTEGRVPAQQRALLAVRACRDDPGWTDRDLRQALSGTLRRIRRQLATQRVPAQLLGPEAVLAALGDLAHHEPARAATEGWTGLHLGGLRQTTLRVSRWPGSAEALAELLPRLLTLPTTAITVGITADAGGGQLTVRVAAPDAATLGTAVGQVHRRLDALGGAAERLDGAHRAGLAGTLPLAAPHRADVPVAMLDGLRATLVGAGLMLGRDRHDEPVTAQLLRPEPTRAVLVGGVPLAALVTVRALALAAQVTVQTGRPDAWSAFLRGVSGPADGIVLVPPGRPVPMPPATGLAPHLLVVDAGPIVGDLPSPPAPWHTTLLVRDDLAGADWNLLAHADLVILPPLSAEQAALAGSALGLGGGQQWLTRIRDGMVGLVSRRTVRWALLSQTPIERQLVGAALRGAAVPEPDDRRGKIPACGPQSVSSSGW